MQPREIQFSPEEEARAAAAAFQRDKRNVVSATCLFVLALVAVLLWYVLVPAYSLFAIGAMITLVAAGMFCMADIAWRRRCARRGHAFVHCYTQAHVEAYQCLHCREMRYAKTERSND